MGRKVKVLIVDDSALVRQMLSQMLSSDPEVEVVGTAADPLIARQKIKELNPDVVTLDIEMPNMDGLSFLEKIMRLRPMPVVMVSSLTQKGAEVTVQALEMGAVDFVAKPTIDVRHGLQEKAEELLLKVKTAALSRVVPRSDAPPRRVAVAAGPSYRATDRLVAVGASTGGVEALKELVCALPADGPAMVITQHMPGHFTASFAKRLNAAAALAVAEAQDGMRILPGHVYIAPGDHHLRVIGSGSTLTCRLDDGPLVSGHRPSVDVLFTSVAEAAGRNAVGIILTGMGKDGAEGLKRMKDAGAVTIGQDESTCVVYGMPKAAKALGGVQTELPLGQIAGQIIECCQHPVPGLSQRG
jgi:two-component system chemotaxis response regulator CheB